MPLTGVLPKRAPCPGIRCAVLLLPRLPAGRLFGVRAESRLAIVRLGDRAVRDRELHKLASDVRGGGGTNLMGTGLRGEYLKNVGGRSTGVLGRTTPESTNEAATAASARALRFSSGSRRAVRLSAPIGIVPCRPKSIGAD